MSTVIGIVQDGKVYMGCDSYATTEDGVKRNLNKVKKMFTNGPYLIGYIGSVRAGQTLLPHVFTPPKNVMNFPDVMIKQFEEKGCLATDPDSQTSAQQSNFLIATTSGKLYEVLADFQINDIDDYTAIGSGSHFAYGSLYTTRHMKDPRKRLKIALETAAFFDTSTGPPFIIEIFLEDES